MSDVPANLDAIENDPKGMRKLLEEIGPELRDTKSELAKAQEQIASFQRNEVFQKAEVPSGDEGSVAHLFRQHYEGDLTPESIKEAWNKLGLPEPAPAPAPTGEPAAAATTQAAEPAAVDPATAAAIADGQELRTTFSPPMTTEGAEVLAAMQGATSIDDIERIAREAGVPMID